MKEKQTNKKSDRVFEAIGRGVAESAIPSAIALVGTHNLLSQSALNKVSEELRNTTIESLEHQMAWWDKQVDLSFFQQQLVV